MIIDNPFLFYAVAAVVAFLIGLSKGGLGGALGALATPLMALVVPGDSAVGLVLPILMIGDVFAVALHWGGWNRRLVLLLIPGAVVGVTIGAGFLTALPGEVLRRGLGAIVLLFVAYELFEARIMRAVDVKGRAWLGLLAGAVTGFSSSLAHIGGPPVSIYLLLEDVTPRVFIATSALFFLILNWIKVPYYLAARQLDLQQIRQIAVLMPLVPAGVWAGRWAAERVEKRTFDTIVVGLLALTAVLLLAG